MNSNVLDAFQTVKNIFYIGNYELACQEATSVDINEEDLSQEIKKYFYTFLSYVEDDKTNEMSAFLKELKNKSSDQNILIYYKIFGLFLFYYVKREFDEKYEQTFEKIYNDLKKVSNYNPVIFPAVYIVSIILIDRHQYDRFLSLIEKFEVDLEILALKFYLFLQLNKYDEMEKTINTMTIKESDSHLTQVCLLIFSLYKNNDIETAMGILTTLKKNNKVSIKMYNFIGVTFMSKGSFEEAFRVLNMGKDAYEKNGDSMHDYYSILVNSICCARNLGLNDDVRSLEELLKKQDDRNNYFKKLHTFDEEFSKISAK